MYLSIDKFMLKVETGEVASPDERGDPCTHFQALSNGVSRLLLRLQITFRVSNLLANRRQ